MSTTDQSRTKQQEKVATLLTAKLNRDALLICAYDKKELVDIYEKLTAAPNKATLIRYLTATESRAEQVMLWLKAYHPHLYQTHPRFRQISDYLKLIALLGLMGLVIFASVILFWIWTDTPPPTVSLEPYCKPQNRPSLIKVGILSPINQCIPDAWQDLDRIKIQRLDQSFEEIPRDTNYSDYQLLIGGNCPMAGNGEAALTFTLQKFDKPDEIYQPKQITVTSQLTDVVPLGLAIFSYQDGNYDKAILQLDQLNEVLYTADIALLKANAYLFNRNFADAEEIYTTIINRLRPNWSAAYNNRGMIAFNLDVDRLVYPRLGGREDFEASLAHFEAEDDPDLKLLALGNASASYLQEEEFELAEEKCDEARDLDGHSVYFHDCMASYHFRYYNIYSPRWNYNQKATVLRDLEAHLVEDIQSDAPVIQHHQRAYLHKHKEDMSKAIIHAEKLQQRMAYRTCLPYDESYLRTNLRLTIK